MDQKTREGVLAELAQRLRDSGSWAGATHMQKCVYFLQEAFSVDLGYKFVIHYYGPFSSELDSDLADLRRREVLETTSGGGYGVHFTAGPKAPPLGEREAEKALDRVIERFGGKNATDLGALATSLFVARKLGGKAREDEVIQKVKAIKPGLADQSIADAYAAVRDLIQPQTEGG